MEVKKPWELQYGMVKLLKKNDLICNSDTTLRKLCTGVAFKGSALNRSWPRRSESVLPTVTAAENEVIIRSRVQAIRPLVVAKIFCFGRCSRINTIITRDVARYIKSENIERFMGS